MQQQSPETSGALCKARPMDGLTPQEAAARAAAGLANEAPKPLTKTAGRIVRDNLCTFFNFVFLALAACCVAVGAYRDTLFLGIVVINALIGIVQELRVKHTLDSIALLEQQKEEMQKIRQLEKNGVIDFSDLPVLTPRLREILLKWISDAMESADFSARTDDGRGYRLDRGRADEKCVIHCEDGNFTMPKMRLVFQEAEA